MAQLGNLLVTGAARFVNKIKGTVEKASQLETARTIQTNLASTSAASFDGSANVTPGVSGELPVGNGGTGTNTFTSGAALIGNGSSAVTTRTIRNNSAKSDIGWTSTAASTSLLTQNDIAYWNGRYNSTNSNLEYCSEGAFGDAATYTVETTVANDSKLPTGAAVQSYVTGLGYAPVASPVLTGTPTAPTPIASSNTNQIATTEFVKTAISVGTTASASVANRLSSNDVGSANRPVYFESGIPLACTYSVGNDTESNILVQWDDGSEVITAPTDPGDVIPIANGGTGATTASNARVNLGLGSAATYNVVASVNNDDNLPVGAAIQTYVNTRGFAPVASPTFTGTPMAPTASVTTNNTQVATTAFVQNVSAGPYFATCSTAAGTAAKKATVQGDVPFVLRVGTIVGIKFTATNTATNVTLEVNSTGAKSIWYNNAVLTAKTTTATGYANRVIYYIYDGTYWAWINHSADDNDNTVPSGHCTTAAATAAKTAAWTYYDDTPNSYCQVNFRYANTAESALTLNINSQGAKPIYINGTVSSSSNYTLPAGPHIVFYDGTNYYFRTDGKLPGEIDASVSVKTLSNIYTTNSYGEISTGLSVFTYRCLGVRATVSSALVHTTITYTTDGGIIIVALNRSTSVPLANTSVDVLLFYI